MKRKYAETAEERRARLGKEKRGKQLVAMLRDSAIKDKEQMLTLWLESLRSKGLWLRGSYC